MYTVEWFTHRTCDGPHINNETNASSSEIQCILPVNIHSTDSVVAAGAVTVHTDYPNNESDTEWSEVDIAEAGGIYIYGYKMQCH